MKLWQVERARLPPCLGRYESGDPECDGQPSAGAPPDEALPCLCRDRCVAFQLLLHETGSRRYEHVRLREITTGPHQGLFAFPRDARFMVELDGRIARHQIRFGTVTVHAPRSSARTRSPNRGRKLGPLSPNHRRKLARRARRNLRELRRRLKAEGLTYLALIAEHMGVTLKAEEVGARPGELFLVDKYEDKRVVSLFYRLERNCNKLAQLPVASFRPRIAAGCKGWVELQIACAFDTFANATPERDRKRFAFEAYEQGRRRRVRLRRVTRESAVALAQVVKKLSEQGQFGFGR